jgi:tetratricopeptide (TPR) repeat protein
MLVTATDTDARRPRQALELVEQALAAEPESAHYLDTRGWAFYRLGRFADAEADIRRSLDSFELESGGSRAGERARLARALWAKGEKTAAVRQLEVGEQEAEGDGDALMELALGWMQAQQPDRALALLERAGRWALNGHRYRTEPLLAPLLEQPRYQAVLQEIAAREAVLQESFERVCGRMAATVGGQFQPLAPREPARVLEREIAP